MTWVQNVDKRTRFTEMSNKPHEKVRGGRQFPLPTGVSVSARPVPPSPPAWGSEAGTALFLLVPVPLRAHSDTETQRVAQYRRWRYWPSLPLRIPAGSFCFSASSFLFLYTLKINALFLV